MAKRRTTRKNPEGVRRARAGKRSGLGKKPRLGRKAVERIVERLGSQEAVTSAAHRLLDEVHRREKLLTLRFPPAAVLERVRAATGEGAPPLPENLHERLMTVAAPLVDDAFRERAKAAFDRGLARGGRLEDGVPFLVGKHLVSRESEKRPGFGPIWGEIFQQSLVDAPLIGWLASRVEGGALPALQAHAADGTLRAGFEAWAKETGALEAVAAVLGEVDLSGLLLRFLLGYEAKQVVLPLGGTFRGLVAAARLTARRHSLQQAVGFGADVQTSDKRLLESFERALELDAPRALPAFRAACCLELEQRVRELRGSGGSLWAKLLAAARPLAALLGLEVLAPALNYPLATAYRRAPEVAYQAASPAEKVLLGAVLDDPLDPALYRRYALWLLSGDRPGLALSALEVAKELGAEGPELEALTAEARAQLG